ncbi:hypothetical protein HYQ19_gp098 [Arthrobacter phage DrYang]|uniref:Uncharacterized protein n=1 Tax=Arthrobacter phage DrYang TaxID=2686080 RepID=A0A6B9JKS4_9CAUD|nr:hypothetical protein HYQ19_gp098 [Arthrobacter phage DrYang]QGZ17197.1 hypothetical protein SEA_DRYANG_98 [Arthrobacter phage DrYang]
MEAATPVYTSTVDNDYGHRTVTNTQTGHVIADGDFVTIGKAKTEWRVCYVYVDGRVQLERQAHSPKRGMTRRFEQMENLTVTYSPTRDSEEAPKVEEVAAEERPAVKTTRNEVTYFGRRCVVTTIQHEANPMGLRTIRTEWVDAADPRNGGWAAGTVAEKVVKGDGRDASTFEVLTPEHMVSHTPNPKPKLTKKAQAEYDAWAARIEAEGIHVGQEVMATRVETDARDYVTNQWEEPATIVELRNFDALVQFEDGTRGSSGLGLRVRTDTPTGLLHPKQEVFNVSANLDGRTVVETVTVKGDIGRARSVAGMLACKYGLGKLSIGFTSYALEYHDGQNGGGVEIEDMDADDPWEHGPHDEELTAEMNAPIGD